MKSTIFLLLLASCLVFSVDVLFQNNDQTCSTLIPSGYSVTPQAKNEVFKILTSTKVYKSGDVILVTIRSSEPIINFLLTARLANKDLDQSRSFGNFKTSDVSSSNICSSSYGSSITLATTSNELKKELNFEWTSLQSTKGHLYFKASVIISTGKFWAGELSDMILDSSLPAPPDTKDPSISSAHALTTEQCGKTKGCYRNPTGCNVNDCDTIVMWTDHKDYVDFQMSGDTEGFVSVSFSDDAKQATEIFECIYMEMAKKVEVRHLRLRTDGRSTTPAIIPFSLINDDGWLDNRRISCSFRWDKTTQQKNGKVWMDSKYLLLNKGRVDKNGEKILHGQELVKYPYVSPQMVKPSDKVDLVDNLRYALVKAHGCLMVIAWMVSAMTGLLLSKYYRPMWPNSRWCGRRVWFSGYMFCMVTCLVLTVISFILIFIHGGGYIQLSIYPDKAHPPIGIVTTILIILIPLLALCRSKDIDYDPPPYEVCINWFLWLLETAASVLATVNMFIGLNLRKAHVPWWTTWVIVAFFLFHLIVELILEIHGCLNSNKMDVYYVKLRGTKEPSRPEPVGRAFKQRTLNIYLVVSICLGLVIVISIAAG